MVWCSTRLLMNVLCSDMRFCDTIPILFFFCRVWLVVCRRDVGLVGWWLGGGWVVVGGWLVAFSQG